MRAQATTTPFEVYCNRCGVTFAAENRRCLHCGSCLHRDRVARDMVLPPEIEIESMVEVEAVEPEPTRRRLVSARSGIWILLAVWYAVNRACTGG